MKQGRARAQRTDRRNGFQEEELQVSLTKREGGSADNEGRGGIKRWEKKKA